jgi:predicted nucleic acid-binding protein
MVLADTSVWIRYLMGRAPYLAELGKLLALDQVVGHDLVYGELLIGDSGGHRQLLTDYAQRRFLDPVPHDDVVAFVRKHALHGRGVGWIDVHLLASALTGHCELWTADASLAELAAAFRVAHVIR